MKFKVFKVFKVITGGKRTLEYQLEVGEVRPGTSHIESAVEYLLSHVAHNTSEVGTSPLLDSIGVHLTRWVVLDDTDIYWFIPVEHSKKQPALITV